MKHENDITIVPEIICGGCGAHDAGKGTTRTIPQ